MMAAPQRHRKVRRTAPGPAKPVYKPASRPAPGGLGRQKGRVQRRRFVVLVVLPVLLMLGSVYLHTVAADLGNEATSLEKERAGLLVDKERLEVEVSELSAPGRIRAIAREDLGMESPGAEDMRSYDREDGEQDVGQEIQEGSR